MSYYYNYKKSKNMHYDNLEYVEGRYQEGWLYGDVNFNCV
jgi:hypothetical protein